MYDRAVPTTSIEATLDSLRPRIETALQKHAEGVLAGAPKRLADAARYALMAGGKRLRPALVLLCSEACGGKEDTAMPTACAIEMIHTYSLVHDDLPAMDDDDLRRGKATVHKQFDEATAILAGDTLLTGAFEVIARNSSLPPERKAAIIALIARAAGARGMAGGQQMDLDAENNATLSLDDLVTLHKSKTGALIAASCAAGAMAAGAPLATVEKLSAFGLTLGLAFQVTDDILDVTASSETLGKSAGKDVAQGKLTYPALLGLEKAKQEAQRLSAEAKAQLAPIPNSAKLAALADYVVSRTK